MTDALEDDRAIRLQILWQVGTGEAEKLLDVLDRGIQGERERISREASGLDLAALTRQARGAITEIGDGLTLILERAGTLRQ